MSAPILDVFDGVLLLPVIGSLDDSRARTITERLLSAVVSHRSKLVLIDLTAVETMDQTSATALRRMLTAIEMLGSRPIVTGISPQIAQMLTQLGDRGDIFRKPGDAARSKSRRSLLSVPTLTHAVRWRAFTAPGFVL